MLKRPGRPPKLCITGIVLPQCGFRAKQMIENRLAETIEVDCLRNVVQELREVKEKASTMAGKLAEAQATIDYCQTTKTQIERELREVKDEASILVGKLTETQTTMKLLEDSLAIAKDDLSQLAEEKNDINQKFSQQVLVRHGNKGHNNWRQKSESQRGAVLAIELKNNTNKLPKWNVQVILVNAELMRLGHVSRVHHRDHFIHVILGVVGYKQWLISWDGLPSFATWKDFVVLLSQIRYFDPWGQGSSKGEELSRLGERRRSTKQRRTLGIQKMN
ncbi:hypothetical protein F3Y22_tig00112632pilonHSYRG00089 [Hibiscus syriacus]|uniref:Uncharacterized protein n=1 Tax=Hibiscus syriacus TaxID=106335 RepID=A0A6A2Y1C0_HIBSY|nr:hypothetical protein F3Y22_tig00112632pilonHSYRG00089 [Hibiscus syriacus]